MTLKAVKALLKKAATILQKKGLAKGNQQDPRGRLCVYGALLVADGLEPNEDPGSALVARAAQRLEISLKLKPDFGWSAADWNNKPERTKKEVVAALRKAAK